MRVILTIDFDVFPNPATNLVNVNLATYLGKAVDLTVYNSLGQVVKFIQLDDVQYQTEQIQVAELQNGSYYIEVRTEGDIQTKKFIISGK